MRTEIVNEHKIEFFDTPEKLPIKRFQKFNKFFMIGLEVGSDFTDYQRRTSSAIEYLKKDEKDLAIKELNNREQMIWNLFSEYSPSGMALAVLVKSINGVEYKDYDEENLEKILDKLEECGYSQENLKETIDEVKKK